MKKEKEKMLLVNESTHKKVKLKALIKGMSIKEYVEFLVEKEK